VLNPGVSNSGAGFGVGDSSRCVANQIVAMEDVCAAGTLGPPQAFPRATQNHIKMAFMLSHGVGTSVACNGDNLMKANFYKTSH